MLGAGGQALTQEAPVHRRPMISAGVAFFAGKARWREERGQAG